AKQGTSPHHGRWQACPVLFHARSPGTEAFANHGGCTMKTGCFAEPILPHCSFFRPVELTDDFDRVPVARRCFFYEDLGRDPSLFLGCERWRVVFYYASHLAITKVWASKEQKDAFLATLEKGG